MDVMDPNTPMTIAAAKYATREEAVEAFKTVWGARHQGEFDHMALAVLTKDAHGQLQVERHDSTTKHLAWGGGVLGAALVILVPPVGVSVAAGGGALAGLGAWVGHFWHTIPKDDVHEMGDLLESGESGIVVVAVNRKGTDIQPLLMHPEKSKVVQTTAGDWEAVAAQAVEQAKREQAGTAAAT
jgi:uncharacterized membrane protein